MSKWQKISAPSVDVTVLLNPLSRLWISWWSWKKMLKTVSTSSEITRLKEFDYQCNLPFQRSCGLTNNKQTKTCSTQSAKSMKTKFVCPNRPAIQMEQKCSNGTRRNIRTHSSLSVRVRTSTMDIEPILKTQIRARNWPLFEQQNFPRAAELSAMKGKCARLWSLLLIHICIVLLPLPCFESFVLETRTVLTTLKQCFLSVIDCLQVLAGSWSKQ